MAKSTVINCRNIFLFAVAELAMLSLAGLAGFKGRNIKTVTKEKLMKKTINKEKLMKDIVSKTLTSHNLEDAVKNISIEIGKLFDADRVYFRFYDPSINAFSKVIEEYRKDILVPSAKDRMIYSKEFDRYLFDQIFVKKKIFFLNNPDDPRYPESFKEIFKDLDIKNEIVIPILYDDNPEGAFFITNTKYAEEWSPKDIEELMPVFQQIAIGTHLFKINDNLVKTSEYERILREIIDEVRRYEDPEEVFRYLIIRLADLFHINRVLDLKKNEENNLYVFSEELREEELGRLKNQVIFYNSDYEELIKSEESRIIVINDISDIDNPIIQDSLSDISIKAFLLYPIIEIIPELKKEKVTNRIMLCSSTARLWTTEEVEALKLIVGAVALVFIEIRKRKELEQTRQTFLATLTHDLKSPIISEQKALEMILSKNPETPLSDFKEYLEDIYQTNGDLLRIADNIVTTYHYESGQIELNLSSINPQDMIYDAVRVMNPLAKEQESEIHTDIQEGLPQVMVDKDEIERVIINLLSNAIKHNKKGTIINVSAHRVNNEVQFAISDNGSGIPESERPNIFQKYPTTKRKIGTGLGLYLSKQIIDAHHGRIWFETEEGKGTTFYFTCPLTKS